jgi:hypothetical protein
MEQDEQRVNWRVDFEASVLDSGYDRTARDFRWLSVSL